MFKNRLCAMPASSFVLNVPRLNLTPLIVVFALYFSPFLYTPIKPVEGLGFPCIFWVVEVEEDEEEEEDKEDEEDKEEEEEEDC